MSNANTPIQDVRPVFRGNGRREVYEVFADLISWALATGRFNPHQFSNRDAPLANDLKVLVAATLFTRPYMVHVILMQVTATTPKFLSIDAFLSAALNHAIHFFRTTNRT